MAMKKVYFVSYDEGIFNKAKKKYGIGTFAVPYPPKSLGPTQTDTLIAKYDATSLLVDKTIDPDVVTELLRIFDKFHDKLGDFSASGKWIKREHLGTSGYQTPDKYHPSALKYFKANGIPVRVHPW